MNAIRSVLHRTSFGRLSKVARNCWDSARTLSLIVCIACVIGVRCPMGIQARTCPNQQRQSCVKHTLPDVTSFFSSFQYCGTFPGRGRVVVIRGFLKFATPVVSGTPSLEKRPEAPAHGGAAHRHREKGSAQGSVPILCHVRPRRMLCGATQPPPTCCRPQSFAHSSCSILTVLLPQTSGFALGFEEAQDVVLADCVWVKGNVSAPPRP